MSEDFAPRRRPWLTHGVVALATFGITTLVIQNGVRRQTAIHESMEMWPVSQAASLAYGWGSVADAQRLLEDLRLMAEHQSSVTPVGRVGKDPDFATLRKMDADMAKLRLALLEGAPREKLQELCAKATIRCTPHTLEGLIALLKKQRHVK